MHDLAALHVPELVMSGRAINPVDGGSCNVRSGQHHCFVLRLTLQTRILKVARGKHAA